MSDSTRQQMESSFGTGFSAVRIHTGSTAVQMNKALGAQAFTNGNDIYFGAGKYDPTSASGKHLLAHELTHTIQQGKNIIPAVQKQGEPPGSADQSVEQEPAWDPEEVIMNYLQEWEDEKNAKNEEDNWGPVELSDEGPSAWIGSGPRGQRKYLLLYSEWQKLSGDETYKNGIAASFLREAEPGEAYLTSLKASLNQVSTDEQATLAYINQQLALSATAENFIDLEPFRSLDAANAFPNFSWQIVIKLIAPPEALDSQVSQDYTLSKKYYESYWAQLANDLYTNGLPVSYIKSLNLYNYRLIRPLLVKRLPNLPDQPYMLENFIAPGETGLYSAIMKHCVSSFAYYGASAVKLEVLNKWKEASAFRWLSYDTRAISDFRQEYPTGFSYLDQFYRFEHKGVAYSLAEIAIAILLQLVGAGGQSPYKLLGFKSAAARDLAPEFLNLFVQQAYRNFDANFQLADGMIASLSPNDKLLKAVNWSLEKGLAGQSINMLLDKLDEILLDILKEWAKQKAIKKGVTTVLNIVGAFNPLGRLVSFVYTAYDTYDDIEDLTEIIGLVNSLVSIMDEARNSKTVIQSQRSAAKLAEATVTIIPAILQILGSKVLDKISKGIVKDVGGTYSEAKRNKLLDDTSHKNDATTLKPEEVDAEVLTALKSKVYKSKNKEYDAIIILPNGHQWRRNKQGIWCRASNRCLLPSTNSEFINDLNGKVDQSIHEADIFDPDQAIPPGVKPRNVMAADIGVTLGREFAIENLKLEPMDLPNPLTKSDFSDTGFDDIMADANGNWYIIEFKGGKSEMDPGTATRPPQMSSGWVRHVIQRIRDKGPQWNFIADQIEAKLNNGQLFGYGISTPLDDAGNVLPTVIMPDYNRIQFR